MVSMALAAVVAAVSLQHLSRLVCRLLAISALPLVNGKRWFELSNVRCRRNFIHRAGEMMRQQLDRSPRSPFRVLADVGEVLILPPEYAHEIRNNNQLSFTKAAFKWFYAHLPGFEGFREGTTESHIMKIVATQQLTQQLTLVTKPMSEECASALKDVYTDDPEWHEIGAKDANLRIVARIISRVFLGPELCRNARWLRITSTYTVVSFRAVEELRLWPWWLRSTVHWFLPHCTAARALVREARDLINPVLEQRRRDKILALETGEECEYNDAIEWLEQIARERQVSYDAAVSQLCLSLAAMHSTTDFFTQALFDLASHPELMQPLRAEVESVLGTGEWSKTSLYNLKLMDSVLKESQRLKPIAITSMRRYTTTDVELSDGTVLPGGYLTMVSVKKHWDPQVYAKPHEFDGYRFYKMRQQPGKENTSQLVSATADHMGFGYGHHACPGRFFAAEEIKIALCHILLKYDFKLVPGHSVEPVRFGVSLTANPTAKLAIRRRKGAWSI
ncbi:hypothetical protein UVI_02064330 [Ustilaginoidea virens]|nr:hypothetical protein UVI_02064330 [Ustilaginoidea virens]